MVQLTEMNQEGGEVVHAEVTDFGAQGTDHAHMGLAMAGAEEQVIKQLHKAGSIDATGVLPEESDAASCIDEGAEERYSLEVCALAENQILVGIYGVKDEAKQFTSLGFILKEQRGGAHI